MPKRRGRNTGSITPHKRGFRAQYCLTRNGKRCRGSRVFPTKTEAERWLREQQAAGPAAAGTVGDWLTRWLDLHRPEVAASTFARDRQLVETHVRPGIGAKRLATLTGVQVREWLAAMAKAGTSESERQKAGATARKALNAAVDAGLIAVSPMERIRLTGVTRDEQRVMTAAQLIHLADAVTRKPFRAGVLLQADACLRPGELLGLRWGDLDPAAGTIAVRRAICTRTGEAKELKTVQSRRTLPLSAPTLAALAELPTGSPTDPLFPAPDGGHWWYSNWAGKVFRPLAKAAGLEWATPYTLRHTGASLLLSAGVNVLVVSRRLGHRDAAMTLRVYSHLMPDDQAKAAAVFGGLLEPISPPIPHSHPDQSS
jgi:integrase